jgi:hypothetical protein
MMTGFLEVNNVLSEQQLTLVAHRVNDSQLGLYDPEAIM